MVAVPASFALARRITPVWSKIIAFVLGALLVLQMVPQPMTVIPLYSVLAGWHLLGTLPGLILADIALLLPFAIMLLRPFVLAISPALYEAAEIDGATTLQSFRAITVPMHQGQRGHPVRFGLECTSELLNLQGNQGASQLIRARNATDSIALIDVDDAGCVLDVDTLDDLQRAEAFLLSHKLV